MYYLDKNGKKQDAALHEPVLETRHKKFLKILGSKPVN